MTDTLRAALYCIPADDREVWWRMGAAIKSELGDGGFDLWDAWSRQSDRYQPSAARSTWKSLKPGLITIGSLYHEAKQWGWQGEEPVRRREADDDRRRREDERLRLEAETVRRQQRAAHIAQRMIEAAVFDTHPYLAKKGFPESRGLVLDDKLLIPMRDYRNGALQSIQTISPISEKKFLPGGKARGATFRMGAIGSTHFYCEGYATALSVKTALQHLYQPSHVVVCFSAANIPLVARRGYVIADHDLHRCGNRECKHTWDRVGLPFDAICPRCGGPVVPPAGEKYAVKTGLPYWVPPEPGDANDYHLAHGVKALADELRGMIQRGSAND